MHAIWPPKLLLTTDPWGNSADSVSHRGKTLPVRRLGSALSSAGAARPCHSLSTVLPQRKAPAPGSRLLLKSKLNRASNSAGAGCSPGYRHSQSVLSDHDTAPLEHVLHWFNPCTAPCSLRVVCFSSRERSI